MVSAETGFLNSFFHAYNYTKKVTRIMGEFSAPKACASFKASSHLGQLGCDQITKEKTDLLPHRLSFVK